MTAIETRFAQFELYIGPSYWIGTMNETSSTISGLLTKSELSAKLKISPRTIENMVRDGRFPPAVRIGKFVYWSERAIVSWQEKLFAAQNKWQFQ